MHNEEPMMQDTPPRGRPRPAIALLGLVALLAIGITGVRVRSAHGLVAEAEERGHDVATVRTLRVERGDSTAVTRLPGQTAAWHAATLYGRVNGFVATWTADLGDAVRRGETLATLETPELDAELAAARAQLAAARAQTQLARTTDERWRNTPTGAVAEQERDTKHAERTAAEAAEALAAARVAQYEVLAGFKHVTAPFDGRVAERSIDVGTLVTAGSTSTTTPLYRIVQDAPLRVYVNLPQSLADAVVNGDGTAEVYVPGSRDAPVTGRIVRQSGALDPQTRTRRVEVDVPNADHRLLPGAYVEVGLHVGRHDTLSVPAQAIRMGADGPEVLRVDKNDRVEVVRIDIARDDGRTVDVLRGVQAGDRLIVNPPDTLKSADAVKVATTATPAPLHPR
jgi:RND family efflux transporter MFP subunit